MVYAGFWRRFMALVIDGIILFIPCFFVTFILPVVGPIVLGILYRPFFESSVIQGTPGKIFMGMIVTNLEGQRITFQQSLIRYGLSVLSGCLLFLGHFFNLFTAKRQAFHDLVANTLVLERETNTSIQWFDVWLAEFKRIVGATEQMVQNARSDGAAASGDVYGTPKNSSENIKALEDLHALYSKGALTEAEYNDKKSEILRRV